MFVRFLLMTTFLTASVQCRLFSGEDLPTIEIPHAVPQIAAIRGWEKSDTIDISMTQLGEMLWRTAEPPALGLGGSHRPFFEIRKDEPQLTASEQWQKDDVFFRGLGDGFLLRSGRLHSSEPLAAPLPTRGKSIQSLEQ